MAIDERHVVILSGGISHERDVSLRSGRRVADALARLGARVTVREPDADLLPWLAEHDYDVVWPLLHGASGEDGALYSLLRAGRIPYVGSRPTAARLAWSKPASKALAKRAGLRTPRSLVLRNSTFRELGAPSVIAAIADALELPAAVKPAEGGSAQGVSFVERPGDFTRAFVTALTYGDPVMVERAVVGRDVMVGIIDLGEGPHVVSPVEVVPSSGFFDYAAHYNAGETTYYAPARLPDEALRAVEAAALKAYRALGLADIARVDFIVDDAGTPWFLEADPIPGMTETSLVPLGIEAAGLIPAQVYGALAERAALRGPRS